VNMSELDPIRRDIRALQKRTTELEAARKVAEDQIIKITVSHDAQGARIRDLQATRDAATKELGLLRREQDELDRRLKAMADSLPDA